jgi:cytochrome P450
MSAIIKEALAPANDPETELPTGVRLTPLDETFRNNPYPILEQLRNAEPVHRDKPLGRWFITGFEEVREVLRNKDLSTDADDVADPESYMGRIAANAEGSPMEVVLDSMLYKDDPDHRRLRALVSKPFSAKAVEELRPRIKANVAQLLDTVTDARFDLVKAVADPLPVLIISEMLGVEGEMRATFKKWSVDFMAGFFNPLKLPEQSARGVRAAQEIGEYFTRAMEARRKQPGTDLISMMVTASEGDERLTDAEILAQCDIILVAGNITTTDLIGNSIKALLQHPEQLAALRNEPELITNAIEEVLRYDSSVTQAQRIVPADGSVAGCPMHKGQSITVSIAAANHDPRANPEPERFDIRRKEIHHQSFGGGRHLCLGAHLARVEAQEAVLGIIQRFPKLSLVEQKFEYKPVPSLRGLTELWLSRE